MARWKAIAATGAAMTFGWTAGRFGLSNALAIAVLAGLGGLLAYGVAHELLDQLRGHHEFDDIDARHQVERALKGERH